MFAGFIINLLWVDGVCTVGLGESGIRVYWYERRLMYWWDGGGEDEKGLIIMFTTVYSELSLVPGDGHVDQTFLGKSPGCS